MSYHIQIPGPGIGYHDDGYASVGTNGSQEVMVALWMAAYAVAGRPDSKRVTGWVQRLVNPYRRNLAADAPWVERGKPSTVRDLIAYNLDYGDGMNDEGTAVTLDRRVVDHGLKCKAPTDPMLADLVEMYRVIHTDGPEADVFPADLCVRLADHLTFLLPHLETSTWHEVQSNVARVFRTAAERGTEVRGY